MQAVHAVRGSAICGVFWLALLPLEYVQIFTSLPLPPCESQTVDQVDALMSYSDSTASSLAA
ncbi:hypothetical protein HaLaN_05843 [Haematococcus lacustris]|uniref:Uncharacterized protein n=1 Tax=Haematococcus lacustris TaxID=44745 RepID=A0A699YJV0_HAELA|nr:hypothetical protein HaLaN_05843 [Haematococcus lacustris]